MPINEILLNGTEVMSTRGDTVSAETLVEGETATDASGKKIVGNLQPVKNDETYLIEDEVDDITDDDYIPYLRITNDVVQTKKTFFGTIINKLKSTFATINYVKPPSIGNGYTTGILSDSMVVALIDGYKLQVGGIIALKFNVSVPADATLNVNSTGEKEICYRGDNIAVGKIVSGDIALFVYDGTVFNLIGIDRVEGGSSAHVDGTTLYL